MVLVARVYTDFVKQQQTLRKTTDRKNQRSVLGNTKDSETKFVSISLKDNSFETTS